MSYDIQNQLENLRLAIAFGRYSVDQELQMSLAVDKLEEKLQEITKND